MWPDILLGTQALMSQVGLKVIIVHVKGHQDGWVPTVLAHDATLNVEANALAKAKLVWFWPGPTQYCIPFGAGTCYLRKRRIVKQLTSQLCSHLNGIPMQQYWQKIPAYQGSMEHHWLDCIHQAMVVLPLHCHQWGGQIHLWAICPWQEYATIAVLVMCSVPLVSLSSGR